MEDIGKDWRSVYCHLSQPVPQLLVPMLDTVTCDVLPPRRPMLWIGNDLQGAVGARDVRMKSLQEVLQEIVQKTAPSNAKSRYFPQADKPDPIVMVIAGSRRLVQTAQSLFNIPRLYSKDLEGLTVLHHPGFSFDPRLFIYQINAREKDFDDSVRVRARDTLENAEGEVQLRTLPGRVHSGPGASCVWESDREACGCDEAATEDTHSCVSV